uniref:Uncharacterized protein n=1 Tax=Alexandrium monilatum TaxID=311494 RepID=A0A7S4QRB7_9DINO|mmetsp:Transcript_77761/g.240055  ORF Transcript_77761/g.240055 Transcript_77761/m.240055 type:complete len:256 (+) Transcript_77761:71-838(+)
MGLPMEAARSPPGQASGAEFLEAPLRLQTESYEAFAAQLHIGQDDAEHRTVEEELRELQIDPEVFYRDARRLGARRFSSDDLDPTGVPPPPLPRAAGAASSISASPAAAAAPALNAESSRGGEDLMAGGWAFKPPDREPPLPEAEDDGDGLPPLGPCVAALLPGLNVPDHSDIEDIPYEEIALDGETRGGRMGRETPRGLSAKLQIDTLTDDDDEDFRGPILSGADPGNEDDEVEAFALDPEFDYDKVDNLTGRL